MKKILVLGSDYGTREIVQEAHKMGLYVVVADWLETTPTKELADEKWLVSTTDIDSIEKKCLENNICAIITGASDFNISNMRKICKRLNLPMYCEDDGAWEVSTNKRLFKDLCKKVGARIAEDYVLDKNLKKEDLQNIKYPVVVKPVDKSGNRGMSYCKNEKDLIEAYKYAGEISSNPTIIVERELQGPDFCANYVIADGKVSMLYFSAEHNQPGQKHNLYSIIYTTSFELKRYLEEMDEKVKEVFVKAGCRNGIAWVETILDKDGHFYLLEMGHRYGGEMTYVPYEKVSGFNSIKWMLECQLGIKHTELDLHKMPNIAYTSCAASSYLFLNPAGAVAKFDGIEKLTSIPDIFLDLPKRVGAKCVKGGSLGIIRIYSKNCEELCDKIALINETLNVEDAEGNELIIKFDDYKTLINEYRNGLREFGQL